MAIDVTNLVHSLGINLVSGTNQYAGGFSKPNPAAKPDKPATGPGAFLGSVGNTIAHGISGGAQAVVHDLSSGFQHVASGITQGLPGVGSIAQNQRVANQTLKDLSHAQHVYTQQYAAGKISKARYTTLLKDLGKQYTQASAQSAQNAKTTTPKEFASGLATVASLPFAAGNLTGEGALASRLGATAAPKSGAVGAALKAPIKQALITGPVANAPVQVASDVANKNYGAAAGTAAIFAGAPAAIKLAQRGAPIIAGLFKNEQNFSNALKFKGGATIGSHLADLRAKAEAGDAAAAQQLKQDTNRAKVFIDHAMAEGRTPGDIASYHATTPGHLPTKELTVPEFLQTQNDLAKATKAAQAGVRNGSLSLDATGKPVPADLMPRVGAGRFDQGIKSDLINRLQAAPDMNARLSILADDAKAGAAYTQNPSVFRAIQAAAAHDDPKAMANEIKAINATRGLAATPSKSPTLAQMKAVGGEDVHPAQKELNGLFPDTPAAKPVKLPGGYIPIIKPEGAAGFSAPSRVADKVLSAEKGIFGGVTAKLEKAGLSPQSSDAGLQRASLISALDNRFAGTKFEGQGAKVLKDLNALQNTTKGVYDPRLLRVSPFAGSTNIETGLGLGRSDAKFVSKALKGAYADLPKSVRGIGGKITDLAIQKTGPIISNYLKAQGYGRFTLNPVFWAKQGIKGEFIAQAETGGKTPNLNRFLNSVIGTAPSKDTQSILQKEGWFSRGQSAGGEADFFGDRLSGDVAKNVKGSDVSQYIMQSMGQLAEKFAKTQGKTVAQIFEDGGAAKKQLEDTLQMVVGYPKDGYLNSNLAKTLNVLVFPSRFETKVGLAAGKFLAHQPPIVQGAIVNSLLNADSFMNSPAGKQWQKDNAKAIGLFNYFSPTHTLDSVRKALGGGGGLGDLGSLGGLPFGVITTIIKNQGVNIPSLISGSDVNPATGQPYPQKIPQTDAARVQTALSDLVGSLFSYPGATAGLPSKTSAVQAIPGLKPAKGSVTTIGGTTGTPSTTGPVVRKETIYNGSASPVKNPNLPTPAPKKPRSAKSGPTFDATGRRIKNRALPPGNKL